MKRGSPPPLSVLLFCFLCPWLLSWPCSSFLQEALWLPSEPCREHQQSDKSLHPLLPIVQQEQLSMAHLDTQIKSRVSQPCGHLICILPDGRNFAQDQLRSKCSDKPGPLSAFSVPVRLWLLRCRMPMGLQMWILSHPSRSSGHEKLGPAWAV